MKKSQSLDQLISRRNFLFRGTCASLGVTSIVNTLAHLQLIQSAMATYTAPGDYKAIVCLFLYGGNDSNNMLLPLNGAARTNYDLVRVPANPLHIPVSGSDAALPLTAASGGFGQTVADQFGLHPSMPKLQGLFNSTNASDPGLTFVANVGTLVEPVTRANLPSRQLPPQLFSHSDQQLQWQSSIPDQPFQRGWGGRIADLVNAGMNPLSKVSMNISISGLNSFQVGNTVAQYAISADDIVGLAGYAGGGTEYGGGYTSAGGYQNSNAGRTLQAIDTIKNLVRANLLEEGYSEVMRRARNNESFMVTATGLSSVTIDQAFTDAFGLSPLPDVASQLKMVARLIQGRSALQNNRQIFFVSMAGFDTHHDQSNDHKALLSDLDKSLKGFAEAIKRVNQAEHTANPSLTGDLWDSVVLFTSSDFTRTLQANGSDSDAGTDHGWGGHQIVMGGPVTRGRIFGGFPDLATGTGLDEDSKRGRWIPTTAVDQYGANIAKWFGVSNSDIETIFPNLGRFQRPDEIPGNLNFFGV